MVLDKRLFCTVLALVTITIGTAALVQRADAPEAAPVPESLATVELPQTYAPDQPTADAPPDYTYLIREYEGRVAVYTADDQEEPEMVLDTLVKFLPDYDRSQLTEGIPVKDYNELVALIEDFVS